MLLSLDEPEPAIAGLVWSPPWPSTRTRSDGTALPRMKRRFTRVEPALVITGVIVTAWSTTPLAAVVLLSIGVAVGGSSAAPGGSRTSLERSEIVAAFGHLVGPPRSAVALRPYVQGVDGAMAAALARGAVNQRADDASLLPAGAMHVSSIRRLSASVASVAFGIAQKHEGRFAWRFAGTAVYSQHRWLVSWATVCMLVEQEGVLCPNPPAGVVAALPLPYSVTARQQGSEQSPDLLRPGALALTGHGDLLIADSFRDQILEWHPDGELTVFAGTGQPGFSGDRGPAVEARLGNNLGGMAMSPTGTLYFVDGNRVRAISAGGVITTVAGNGRSGPSPGHGPALQERLDPSDVAVDKDGTPYIAAGDEILRLSPAGGLSTLVKGSGPSGDVTTPSGKIAFSPEKIAFDGAGNLDVFSFSPKAMFQISPSGRIKLLGAAYTAQMTEAPGGDVLTTGHAEQVGRITPSGTLGRYLDLARRRINGLWAPGDQPGLEPDGIAVTPAGVVYLDSFYGNGWAGGTSLVKITAKGTLRALPIHTPLPDTLPAPGSTGFPASVYPTATRARGTDLEACPDSEGLQPFDAHAIAVARAIAKNFNAFTSSFYGDLQSSDRSWWTTIFAEWVGYGYDRDNHTVLSAQPANRDTFALAVAHACGENLLRDSLVIDVGPSGYSFQVSHLYFLDRRGHPLVYFQAS